MYQVDKAVRHLTVHCLKDFSCFSGDESCLCDLEALKEEDIVEIKSKPKIACKYCISLEGDNYCTCPTRVEIFKRYNK
jgi:hypothetical protein